MTIEESRRPARPGRPRDDLDARIRTATLELLASEGYQRLGMGAVAAAAGIGKPTLYRRFAGKAELVAWALVSLTAPAERAELPDDTCEALTVLLAATAGALATPGSLVILGSLLAQASTEPALIAAFREAVFRPQHEIVHAALVRGIERGDVRADVDVDALDAMLFGALLARAILGEPVDAAWARRVVDEAWPSLAVVR